MSPLSIWYKPFPPTASDYPDQTLPGILESNNLTFPTRLQRPFHPSIGDIYIASTPHVVEVQIVEEDPWVDRLVELLRLMETDFLPTSTFPHIATAKVLTDTCNSWMENYGHIFFDIQEPLGELVDDLNETLANYLKMAGINNADRLRMWELTEEDIEISKEKEIPIARMQSLSDVLDLAVTCQATIRRSRCQFFFSSKSMRLLIGMTYKEMDRIS